MDETGKREQSPFTPVRGYTSQSGPALAAVNVNKEMEERLLRRLDALWKDAELMPELRDLAEARTCFQTGFMWLNRAIMKPQRVSLPEDRA